MKLIHVDDLKEKLPNTEPVRLQCASGMAMSQCVHSMSRFCSEKKNSDSRVIWDTAHHEVILWFEDEKYRSYFLLKLEKKGA